MYSYIGQRPIMDLPGNQPTHCITTIQRALTSGMVWYKGKGKGPIYSKPYLEFLNAELMLLNLPKAKDRLIVWNLH